MKYSFYRPYLIFVLLLIGLSVLTFVFPLTVGKFTIGRANQLDEAWMYQGTTLEMLPVTLDIEKGNPFTVQRQLEGEFVRSNQMLIRTSLQDLTVTLDGVVIYEVLYHESGTYASMWHIVTIPSHSDGKILELTFHSPYQAMSGTISEILYGTESQLYQELFISYGLRLLIGLLTFFVGLFIMLFSLFYFRSQNKGYIYIGLFATIASLWVIAESRMLQFMTGNVFIIGSLSYLALALFPIPLVYYFKNYVIVKFKWPYWVMIVLFVLNALMILTFHISGVMDFFETVLFSTTLIVSALAATVVILIIEQKKYDNPKSVEAYKYLAFLGVLALLETMVFIRADFRNTSLFAVIWIGVLMAIVLVKYIRFIISRFKLSYEKEFYERLAMLDPLTGANNRFAFEGALEKRFVSETSRTSIRLVYFDFDDLKYINDHFGHHEGDEAIKKGYEILQETFGQIGECYRIGGDEFACLTDVSDDARYHQVVEAFQEKLTKYDEEKPYRFSMSLGTTLYDAAIDVKSSDLIKRSDHEMYLDKRAKKINAKRIE